MASKAIDKKKVISAYKEVFESEAGKVVLADMLKSYGVLKPYVLSGRSFDIQEGERRVILAIIQKMNYDLSQLNEVLFEYSPEVNYGTRTNGGAEYSGSST